MISLKPTIHHHLLTCHLGVPLPQPVTTMFTYRTLCRIDREAVSWSWMVTDMLICSMLRSSECWTYIVVGFWGTPSNFVRLSD